MQTPGWQTIVTRDELPFFVTSPEQTDGMDLLIWRLKQHGLTERSESE